MTGSRASAIGPASGKLAQELAPTAERITCALLALLFFFAAAVQYNDPDPIRWAAIYLLAMGVCSGHALRPMSALPAAIVALAGWIWALIWAPGALASLPSFAQTTGSFQMMAPGVEELRELVGLLIVALAMTVLALRARSRAARATRASS